MHKPPAQRPEQEGIYGREQPSDSRSSPPEIDLIRTGIIDRDLSKFAKLAALLLITLAPLVLLGPWLVDPHLAIVSPTDLGTDFWSKQWPNATYIVQAWRQWGEVPLWRGVMARTRVPLPSVRNVVEYEWVAHPAAANTAEDAQRGEKLGSVRGDSPCRGQ